MFNRLNKVEKKKKKLRRFSKKMGRHNNNETAVYYDAGFPVSIQNTGNISKTIKVEISKQQQQPNIL